MDFNPFYVARSTKIVLFILWLLCVQGIKIPGYKINHSYGIFVKSSRGTKHIVGMDFNPFYVARSTKIVCFYCGYDVSKGLKSMATK